MKFFYQLILILAITFSGFAWSEQNFDEAEKLWENNKHVESMEFYQKALDSGKLTKKQIVRAHYNRGFAFFKLMNVMDNAVKEFDEVLKLEPNNSEAYCLRGDALSIMNKYQKAVPNWKMSVEINPKDPITYLNRSYYFEEKGLIERAIEDLENYIELFDDYTPVDMRRLAILKDMQSKGMTKRY